MARDPGYAARVRAAAEEEPEKIPDIDPSVLKDLEEREDQRVRLVQ